MSKTNTGGPAFPFSPSDVSTIKPQLGMTLRDYFAAQALQGILSDPDSNGTEDQFAKWAYQSADAMLKAREL